MADIPIWIYAVARSEAPEIDAKGNKDEALIERLALSLYVASLSRDDRWSGADAD